MGRSGKIPGDLTNEEIADTLFQTRKSVDTDYFQPDCERILEKQRRGFLRNELWVEYCAESARAGKKAYRLSRFNELVSDFRTSHDISFTQEHAPGLIPKSTGPGITDTSSILTRVN